MTTDPYLPGQLLALARTVLARPDARLVGVWPRTAAFLGRQALELTMRLLWERVSPPMAETSARAQLLCLPAYVDADVARRGAYTWSALSRLCHQHAYELAPTGGELVGWLDDVERLFHSVDQRVRQQSQAVAR